MKIKSIAAIFGVLSFFVIFSSDNVRGEKPCWNDGTIDQENGGITEGTSADWNQDQSDKDGEPVNLLSGNFSYRKEDISIQSRGIPFVFTRYYNSLDAYNGPFGKGWSHSYNIALTKTSDGNQTYVLVKYPGGHKDIFTLLVDGTYANPSGCYDKLIENANKYILLTNSGLRYEFNLNGCLNSVTDRNNNQMIFAYSDSGQLAVIVDTIGRHITLTYNEMNKIQTIADFTGRKWIYSYNENGDLNTVKCPPTEDFPQGAVITYAYNDGRQLETVTDANGNEYLHNYYGDSKKISWQTYGGGIFTFSYNTRDLITRVKDRNDNITTWRLNEDGTAVSKTISSYTTRYEYNENKEVTKIILPRGNVMEYEYDVGGNITEKRQKTADQPDSADDIVYMYTYEPIYNKLKTYTDPMGNSYLYIYDYQEGTDYIGLGTKTEKTAEEIETLLTEAGIPMGLGDVNSDGATTQINGNLIKNEYPEVTLAVTEPQEIKYLITYNQYGQPVRLTNPNNVISEYSYDTNYYLNCVIENSGGLNITTRLTRDNRGNITSITDPRDNNTFFIINNLNQITRITSPEPFNYKTNISYDGDGNIIQISRETLDPSNPWQTTNYTYNVFDKIETITDELGNIITYNYDNNENLNTITDAENNTTTYNYDERDQVISVTDALGNITTYNYDVNGNLYSIEDANTNSTTYTYDLFDRLTTVTYPNNTTETHTYDKNSNTVSSKNRNNATINYLYDEINRMYQKNFPDSTNVTYTYDALSRLVSVIASGSEAISYIYDNLNRVLSSETNGKTISYEYDNNSNRTKITYPDNLEQLVYVYDQLNRLTDIKNKFDETIAHYTHNALNLRQTMHYLNGITTDYAYNDLSRLVSIIASGSEAISYTYDNLGNRLSMTNEQGTYNYTYDNIYQLTNVSGVQNFSFAYDLLGNRTTANEMNYTTNNLNQYTQVGPMLCSYDNNGNLTSNGTNTYAYDYENRLASVIASDSEAIYSYDGFNRRISNDLDGTTAYYLYDGDNLLVEYNESWQPVIYYTYSDYIDEPITITNASETYYYHSDGLGSITYITDGNGNLVEKYTYDAYGTPTIRNASDEIIPSSIIGNRFMFTGREYDNETNIYYYRARYYNPTMGRFLQTDPIGYYDSMNLYTYVNNNPVNWIDPFGLYGSDVHRDKTKEWSRDVGLPEDVAGKISYYDQKEDENIWTNPFNPFSTWQHFRDRQSVERDLQESINKGDIANFGRYLHEYQDSYSHYDEGFRWWTIGHLGMSDLWDFYDENSPRDQRMEEGTKKWLEKWRDKKECK